MYILDKLIVEPWEGKSSLLFALIISVTLVNFIDFFCVNVLINLGLMNNTSSNVSFIGAFFAFYSSVCIWRCASNPHYRMIRFLGKVFSMCMAMVWIIPVLKFLEIFNVLDQSMLIQ